MLGTIFDVAVSKTRDETFVVCRGEFDMSVADQFRDAVDEVLSQKPRHVHLDCTGVSFIDTVGLRALLHTSVRCREGHVIMTIDMSPRMMRLFRTLGTMTQFNLAS